MKKTAHRNEDLPRISARLARKILSRPGYLSQVREALKDGEARAHHDLRRGNSQLFDLGGLLRDCASGAGGRRGVETVEVVAIFEL